MAEHVTGTFEVKVVPESITGKAPVPGMMQMSIDKTFHGDLDGTSKGSMLTAGDPKAGEAGYVALEVVTGTLKGRAGSFALMQRATMSGGGQAMEVSVVPGSGTERAEGHRRHLRHPHRKRQAHLRLRLHAAEVTSAHGGKRRCSSLITSMLRGFQVRKRPINAMRDERGARALFSNPLFLPLLAGKRHKAGLYSGTASPEPPKSFGKSLNLGRPSFMRSTVSA